MFKLKYPLLAIGLGCTFLPSLSYGCSCLGAAMTMPKMVVGLVGAGSAAVVTTITQVGNETAKQISGAIEIQTKQFVSALDGLNSSLSNEIRTMPVMEQVQKAREEYLVSDQLMDGCTQENIAIQGLRNVAIATKGNAAYTSSVSSANSRTIANLGSELGKSGVASSSTGLPIVATSSKTQSSDVTTIYESTTKAFEGEISQKIKQAANGGDNNFANIGLLMSPESKVFTTADQYQSLRDTIVLATNPVPLPIIVDNSATVSAVAANANATAIQQHITLDSAQRVLSRYASYRTADTDNATSFENQLDQAVQDTAFSDAWHARVNTSSSVAVRESANLTAQQLILAYEAFKAAKDEAILNVMALKQAMEPSKR
ncbi:hypothetical protein [Pokkaliibacter plantistimulans]|nr:hypothetical protein [Pokkaliibacter plantistimulans]